MESELSNDFAFGLSDVKDFYVLRKVRNQVSDKYGLTFENFECSFRGLNKVPFEFIPQTLYQILDSIFEEVLVGAEPEDKVRIRLNNKCLTQPIWTPPIPRSQMTIQRLMLEVEKMLQSKQEFRLDETLEIWAQIAKIPSGSCFKDLPPLLKKKVVSKKCVVQVKNSDLACLPRAFVIGKASKTADNDKNLFKKLHDVVNRTHIGDRTAQTRHARDLMVRAGLEYREYSIKDLQAFQTALPAYQIVVVSVDHLNSVIFSGAYSEKKILLLLHDKHFDVLTSLPAWFDRNFWCFRCNVPYDRRESHRCNSVCNGCLRQDCPKEATGRVFCVKCNRSFPNQDCFAEHRRADTTDTSNKSQRKYSICDKFFVCSTCHRFISKVGRKKPHDCDEQYCSSCREYVASGRHVCFMKREKIDQETVNQHRNAKFLFFDLECYQDKNGVFVPNVAILQDSKGTEFRFPTDESELGTDVTDEFCSFLFDERFRNHYIIAHNFRGFDSYPILRWLLNNGIRPEVIMNGGKVMQLDVKEFGIRFRDSYNYNPQSLSDWAKTFNLAVTEQKGVFPHSYNGPEYWGKVVEYPKREAYDYSMKKKADHKAFVEFYRKDRRKKRTVLMSTRSCSLTALRMSPFFDFAAKS